MEYLRISGKLGSSDEPYVKYEDYINGCTIFAFQLSTELPNKSYRQERYKRGNTSLYVQFAKALAKSVTVFVVGDFEARSVSFLRRRYHPISLVLFVNAFAFRFEVNRFGGVTTTYHV